MPPPLTVTVPHRLGRQEAKRRLDSGLGRLRGELAAFVSALDYRWDSDTLSFDARAIGQTVTGRVEVLEDAVRIELDLPWLLGLLGHMIGSKVSERATLMLERRPGELA